MVEDHDFPNLPKTNKSVAIDVGIEKFLVTSDGNYFLYLKPREEILCRMKHLHKALSRKRFSTS